MLAVDCIVIRQASIRLCIVRHFVSRSKYWPVASSGPNVVETVLLVVSRLKRIVRTSSSLEAYSEDSQKPIQKAFAVIRWRSSLIPLEDETCCKRPCLVGGLERR